jgi:hypothetical protein
MTHISLKNGTVVTGIFLAAVVVLAPSSAMAQVLTATPEGDVRFVGQQRVKGNPDHSIKIGGNVAGVHQGSTVTITAKVDSITAEVQCVNPGGNPFTTKVAQMGTMEQSDDFTKNKQGKLLNYVLKLGPPSTPSAEEVQCTNGNNAGWNTQLVSVTYSVISVWETSEFGADGPEPTSPDSITA